MGAAAKSTVHIFAWEGVVSDDHKPGDLPMLFVNQPTRMGREEAAKIFLLSA